MIIKRFSNNLSFSSASANSKDEDNLIPLRKKRRSSRTKGGKTREKLSATESHNLLREPPRRRNPHLSAPSKKDTSLSRFKLVESKNEAPALALHGKIPPKKKKLNPTVFVELLLRTTGDGPNKICQNRFRSCHGLLKGMKKDIDKKTGKIFLHKSAMQHHAREIHRGEVKPHQCQQCLKSFSSNHQLTQHIRIHTGEKPYKCSYCDRRFKQLSHVQQHTRLHTGERPYKCHLPECGRAFIQLSNLQQHLRNHDSQMERAKNRPFHCNICGKGFASESSLRTHRSKQHAALIGGANSQSCPVCHKICLNAEALMDHMRTAHRDPNASGTPSRRRTTSHPCPVCGKTYVNEGSLRKHIAGHPEASGMSTPLRMWPCTVCQSVFTQESGLLHHMENMRMDPKHQFAAQYVLSRAAAERRQKDVPGMPPPLHGGPGPSGLGSLGPMSHMGQNHPGLSSPSHSMLGHGGSLGGTDMHGVQPLPLLGPHHGQ
ncbi:hypothetical protein JTE90_028796 [Oedothorax gibbosus]|uniref:C2H2-type domain-containing protein n=1 Tax=Oedothorax gibbosus TaxID=931172 RepID=A0AAV6VXG2_9ARAC|nr:hypothetical protein JTE90_028796 [Oedothorax gibbosus]